MEHKFYFGKRKLEDMIIDQKNKISMKDVYLKFNEKLKEIEQFFKEKKSKYIFI